MLIKRWVQPEGIHVELQTWGVVDLRGCFIWTSWCSWAEGHCLWTSPRKAGMSTALPPMGCFWRSSSNKQGSLQATAVLTHSFFLFSFPFYLVGGGVYEKGQVSWLKFWWCSKYNFGPLTPTSHSQRWGHPTGCWAPLQLLPRTRLLAEFAF